jgi:hypothetical protein
MKFNLTEHLCEKIVESAYIRNTKAYDQMDAIDIAYEYLLGNDVARILRANNASFVDSGVEGYFSTMSNKDIDTAYQSIRKLVIDKLSNDEITRSDSDKEFLMNAFHITKKIMYENTGCELSEDTVKTSNGKWTNKGDGGKTHGDFKTKKQADAQRKAMFANGYKHESLEHDDGWPDSIAEICDPFLNKVDEIAYEIHNTIRGAKGFGDTVEDLVSVFRDLSTFADNVADELEEADEKGELSE